MDCGNFILCINRCLNTQHLSSFAANGIFWRFFTEKVAVVIWDEVAAVDMEVSVMHQISDSRSVGITWQDIWRCQSCIRFGFWFRHTSHAYYIVMYTESCIKFGFRLHIMASALNSLDIREGLLKSFDMYISWYICSKKKLLWPSRWPLTRLTTYNTNITLKSLWAELVALLSVARQLIVTVPSVLLLVSCYWLWHSTCIMSVVVTFGSAPLLKYWMKVCYSCRSRCCFSCYGFPVRL